MEDTESLLGGSWVVIGGVLSPLIWVIITVALIITLLITSHEPPSVEDIESLELGVCTQV